MKKTVKHNKLFIVLSAILAVMLGAVAVYAATGAGTESDPVVTRSYVDKAVAAVQNSGKTDAGKDETAGGTSSDSGFQIIEMKAGDHITGYQDTEIIVRSGIVRTSIPGVDGLSDLTSGRDIKNRTTVSNNHLLLVPRSDGRGIVARSQAYVMVKGSYTMENK